MPPANRERAESARRAALSGQKAGEPSKNKRFTKPPAFGSPGASIVHNPSCTPSPSALCLRLPKIRRRAAHIQAVFGNDSAFRRRI
jgi:hypothetical protein